MSYLAKYPVLSSVDPDEVVGQLSSNYRPHRMILRSKSQRVRTVFNRVNLGATTFNFLQYGARVEIQADPFEHFVMVEIPVSGCSTVRYGGEEVSSADDNAVVVSSSARPSSVWDERTSRVMVQINMDRMQSYLTELLGYAVVKKIEFDLALDTSCEMGKALKDQVFYVLNQLTSNNYLQNNLLLRDEMQRNIILMLLMAQRNNFTEQINARARPGEPAHIKRAFEYIKDNHSRRITISDLMAVSGVSGRALYAGFRRYFGMTPMAALKSYRLHMVRNALLDSGNTASITEIASEQGFVHMGNFSKDYALLFKEKPSDTRRHSR